MGGTTLILKCSVDLQLRMTFFFSFGNGLQSQDLFLAFDLGFLLASSASPDMQIWIMKRIMSRTKWMDEHFPSWKEYLSAPPSLLLCSSLATYFRCHGKSCEKYGCSLHIS